MTVFFSDLKGFDNKAVDIINFVKPFLNANYMFCSITYQSQYDWSDLVYEFFAI